MNSLISIFKVFSSGNGGFNYFWDYYLRFESHSFFLKYIFDFGLFLKEFLTEFAFLISFISILSDKWIRCIYVEIKFYIVKRKEDFLGKFQTIKEFYFFIDILNLFILRFFLLNQLSKTAMKIMIVNFFFFLCFLLFANQFLILLIQFRCFRFKRWTSFILKWIIQSRELRKTLVPIAL